MRVDIRDYGALADGATLNTAAIQAAVDACHGAGGGEVLVPKGTFVTGTIQLRSHVHLVLAAGAVLKGSSDLADYPPSGFVHNELGVTRSLIYALGEEDLEIRALPAGPGEDVGTIDLNDEPFFDWERLRYGVENPDPAQLEDWQRAQAVVMPRERPNQPIFFHDCHHLNIEGVRIRRSPCWTLTCSASQDIEIRSLRIDNHLQVPNNDGIHITACQRVRVQGCLIRGGDDAIAITGITDWDRWCEDVTVDDCVLVSRSAGVRVGHLASHVRNVTLRNLVLEDGNRGLGVFAGDGGCVRDVHAENLALTTQLFVGDWWGEGEPLVISAADSTGEISGISVRNVTAQAESGILVIGGETPVEDILLENWVLRIDAGKNRPLIGRILDLQPAPVRSAPEGSIPWLYVEHAKGLTVRNCVVGVTPATAAAYDIAPQVDRASVQMANVLAP